ncbi:MAG: InlB B-repeat-containing protein [Sphaerochaeta associata]|uniref:InlB B-repeat-containing protein n=1 Tax=Sphaerochaeta associata TaxID=1129264 RepID=UPI002B1EF82B|nr:InlB B-repeat-containing protein [Sphaerochaeta associata]MEA5108566.1 InlB B-repeat-containing protein [Sphaerochaeta associata]
MKKSAVVASILLMISIGFVPIVLVSCSNEIPVYTVRFDSRGGNAIEPIETLKNSKLTEPSTPSKTGYEFGGWYKDNSYSERWVFSRDMVRSDMTLYAKWNAHTYAVTYNGNGQSTGTAPPTQTKKHGESLALSTNSGTLERNGYRFGGWNTQSDGFGTNYESGTLYETDTELKLYAEWIAEEYHVTLNKQGGNSGSESITATYDSAMPSATAPIKNGYLFDGYYDQIDGGTQYYSSTMASSKVWDKNGSSDLYAKWTPAYTVIFNSQEGSSVSSLEGVRQGSRISEPAAPTRNGYAFDGWFKDSSCTVAWDFDVETINSNTTLHAKWVVAYTVEFDSQGGSNIAALEGIRQGSKITAPTAPTKNGYVFQGWYKDSDYTTEWDFSVDTVETTVKLVAKWGVAIYTVSFNSQGGTEVTPITNILYGTKISEPVSPTRDRFVFGGWYRDSSYVQRYYFTTDEVTSSMILYAKWFLPHTVSFDSQGGSIVEDITDITHGDLIPEPLAPVKSGYAFDGWHKQSNYVEQWDFDADVITSDMTLYAKWIVLHLVSFDSRGGRGINAIEIGEGRLLTEPADLTRDGYTLDGWYKEIACINRWHFNIDTVTTTSTLYAKWNGINSIVTFDGQGGTNPSPSSKVVTFGQKYGTLPISTRSGYMFDGWWTEPDVTETQVTPDTIVSITSDQTLYAKWIGIVKVEDIGPGGGHVFYDKGWETDGWRYLEAAPSDILLGDSASYHSFGYHRTSDQGSNMTVGTGTGIGSGKENTQKLVGAMGSSVYRYSSGNNTKTTQYAAKMCAEYRGGGYADWFLPSKSELNLMYQNLKKNNLGGFYEGSYWSSSEATASYAWTQDFGNGTQSSIFRSYDYRVRPVRAF